MSNGGKYGVNEKRRTECKASPHHGFYVLGEGCQYCVKEPERPKPPRSFDSDGCYIDDMIAEYLSRFT